MINLHLAVTGFLLEGAPKDPPFYLWVNHMDLYRKKLQIDGLSDLIIHERFLNMCAAEMALFLKERDYRIMQWKKW